MKIQFLITCLVVLFAIGTAKPVERRGLGDTIKGTVKTVQNILNHGIGTFFDPVTEGGSQGACGPYANKASQIVAINGEQYGDMSKKSQWCGKKLKICYKSKCTIATVTDACPGCNKGCLDLTPAVWGQLESDYKKGVIPIEWRLADGEELGNGDDEDDEST